MDNDVRIQAALHGIEPERYEALTRLGLAPDQFELFKQYTVGMLAELATYQLDPKELAAIVQLSGYGVYNVTLYAKLRKRGIGGLEITSLGLQGPARMLEGLEADLPLDIVRRAVSNGVWLNDLLSAEDAGIAFDDLFAAAEVRASAVAGYVKARQQGYSHDDLLEHMSETRRLTPTWKGFEIGDYVTVREAGATHAQVMQIMRDERFEESHRRSYLEYVTHETGGLSHEIAFELTARGVYPADYWRAREYASHDVILEVASRETGTLRLEDFGKLLAENCRIKPKEIVQYACISGGRLYGINDYLKLLDAGFMYEEIYEAHQAGVGLWYFAKLRSEPLSLSQEELLEVARLDIDLARYVDLRKDDVPHGAIVSTARLQHAV